MGFHLTTSVFLLALVALASCRLPTDPTVASDGRTLDDLLAFEKWLTGNGVDLSPFDIRILGPERGGGMGVFAAKPFKKGDTILSVPLNTLSLNGTHIAETQMSWYPKFEYSHECLVVYVLWCRAHPDQCFHSPYVQTLPRDYGFHFMYYDFEDILSKVSNAEGTTYIRSIEHQAKALKASYHARFIQINEKLASSKPDFIPKEFLTEEMIEWACHAVSTRAWGMTDTHVVMNPLFDMFNHNEKGALISSTPEASLLAALIDYEVGDEIYDRYSTKGNLDLISSWSFAICDNAADSIPIQVPIPKGNKHIVGGEVLSGQLSGANHDSLHPLRYKNFRIEECKVGGQGHCLDELATMRPVSLINEVRSLHELASVPIPKPWTLEEVDAMLGDPDCTIPRPILCMSKSHYTFDQKRGTQAIEYWHNILSTGVWRISLEEMAAKQRQAANAAQSAPPPQQA